MKCQIAVFLTVGALLDVAGAANVQNTPKRRGDVEILQIFGEGNLLLRQAELGGGEKTTVDSIRVCDRRQPTNIVNSPDISGRTRIIGGKSVTIGSVELGCAN